MRQAGVPFAGVPRARLGAAGAEAQSTFVMTLAAVTVASAAILLLHAVRSYRLYRDPPTSNSECQS
jgi:hypothetical protein